MTDDSETIQELRALNEALKSQLVQRAADDERRAMQLMAMAGELTLAEQRERRRVADILHDDLQQLLVAAKYRAGNVARKVENDRHARSLETVAALLEQALAQTRSLTSALIPPILHERSLTAALTWLARWYRQKHGLDVLLQVDEGAEPGEESLRILLFQAARELLLNTVKHAEAPAACVLLSRTATGRLRLVVNDHGRGFDPAALEPETFCGYGLLNIRQRLEILGGSLELTAAPGEGVEAIVEVPARDPSAALENECRDDARAAKSLLEAAARAAEGNSTAHPPCVPSGSKRLRILVADDHPIVRKSLVLLLGDIPQIEAVAEAADGQEAVDLARSFRPDVILMDVKMPRLDGPAATRQILRECPHSRVIGLSVHFHGDMEAVMREAGAIAYLDKDVCPEALIALVIAQCERRMSA